MKTKGKNSLIVLRTTNEEKTALKAKAAEVGISLTDYLLKKAEDHVIISPLIGREIVYLLHSLYFQLLDLQNQKLNVTEMQYILNDYAVFYSEHLNVLKLSTGGNQNVYPKIRTAI